MKKFVKDFFVNIFIRIGYCNIKKREWGSGRQKGSVSSIEIHSARFLVVQFILRGRNNQVNFRKNQGEEKVRGWAEEEGE